MGSSIAVPGLPSGLLVPGTYFGINASQANTAAQPQRALLIGQSNNPNGYAANVPLLAGSIQDVRAGAGRGSILALMYEAFRAVDPIAEVWLLPLFDDPASQKAAGLLSLSGTATAAGTLPAYLAGRSLPVPVSVGQTAAQILQNLSVPTNNSPNLPATLSQVQTTGSTSTATFTALNGGLLGNDIDIRLAYLGAAGGEALPAGLSFAITPFTGGTQNPSTFLATALAGLGDMAFDFIGCPYTDTASLNAIQSFLADRWSLPREIFGHAFAAFRGTPAQRTTFSAGRNDPRTSVIGFYDSPTPVWEWAAMLTAAASASVASGAQNLAANPALPIAGIPIPALAPPVGSRDLFGTRQTLLQNGMGTYTVVAGQVVLERIPTTYTTNPATGAPDNSYQDTETDYTLMAVTRRFRTQLATQFQRKILLADGSLLPGGSNMITSQTVLGAAKAIYRQMAEVDGWSQNPDQFDQQALAQNAGGGVVKLYLPVQLANQLRVIAGAIQFTKP